MSPITFGSTFTNGKRTYRVMEVTGDEIWLLGPMGCVFTETLARLTAAGYQHTPAQPIIAPLSPDTTAVTG